MGVRAPIGAVAVLLTLALGAVWPAVAGAAVTITGPASPTNQTSAKFTFSEQGVSQFKCSLDSTASSSFTSCTSPTTLTNLAEGPHTFYVEEANGAAAPTPTPYSWTVDLTPPTTQVTAQPPALTNSKTATFTFTSPDPTATFRCSLNGAAAQSCTSPIVYSGLADATRSLLIQAVDPAGNVDPTAQPIVWTVDSTPPDTTLANPGNLVAQDVAVFSFTSTEAGSTFQCAFGSAPFSACTSPEAVDVPGSGAHSFKVRAIDGAGNVDPTPAVYRWTSDLTPPKRPKVTIFPDPVASAGRVAPVPVAQRNPGLGVTFTNPAASILSTPTFTLATRLRAQWSSDSTAKSYDVTIDEFPQDSTGMGFHGEDLDFHQQYSHTKRTALVLHLYPGSTVCVKVDANDKVGNTSKTRTSCTTIPISFTPRDIGPKPIKDSKAFRGYYIILGDKGFEFVQDIGDEFYFTPTHAALVAERCGGCGVVEFDFDRFVGNPHNKLHRLATVNLTGSNTSGDFSLINVTLPIHRLERDGMGDLVIRAVSGRPESPASGSRTSGPPQRSAGGTSRSFSTSSSTSSIEYRTLRRRVSGGSVASPAPSRHAWRGRIGRGVNPPPQFGHTLCRVFSTQSAQNVHS